MGGAVVAELVTLPLTVFRTHWIALHATSSTKSSYGTVLKAIYNGTIQKDQSVKGIRAFYASTKLSLCTQACSTGSKFTLYEWFKAKRKTTDDDWKNNALNGMLGGVIGATMVHPLEVAKTYQQKQQLFRNVFRMHGIKCIGFGYSQTLIRNASMYSLLLPLNDYFKSTLPENQKWLAPAATSFVTTTLMQPVEFLKTRFILRQPWRFKEAFCGYPLYVGRFVLHMQITMYFAEFLSSQFREI